MNFFAHMLLLGSNPGAEAVLGSVLPDIAKRAGVVLNEGWLQAHKSKIHPDLARGIAAHLHGDRQFHNSALFAWLTSTWEKPLSEAGLSIRYGFFLKHLLAEMWLDRILLADQSKKLTFFYQQLKSLDPALPELTKTGVPYPKDHEALLIWVRRFYTEQFLHAYTDEKVFASIAARVFVQTTRQPDAEQLVRSVVETQVPVLVDHEAEARQHWGYFRQAFVE